MTWPADCVFVPESPRIVAMPNVSEADLNKWAANIGGVAVYVGAVRGIYTQEQVHGERETPRAGKRPDPFEPTLPPGDDTA